VVFPASMAPLYRGVEGSENNISTRNSAPSCRTEVSPKGEALSHFRPSPPPGGKRPSLVGKSESPHTLRHTTAMHLLQAGIDVTVIALWLGHESPETTHQYIEADVDMKRRVLDREEMEVVFTLIAERYERGSSWTTSNLPFAKWESIFKGPMTTATALNRLVHHSRSKSSDRKSSTRRFLPNVSHRVLEISSYSPNIRTDSSRESTLVHLSVKKRLHISLTVRPFPHCLGSRPACRFSPWAV
jgi:IstB-like ATP binding protein/integrase-like protein